MHSVICSFCICFYLTGQHLFLPLLQLQLRFLLQLQLQLQLRFLQLLLSVYFIPSLDLCLVVWHVWTVECAFNPFVFLWYLPLPFYLCNIVFFFFFNFGIICWIRSESGVYGQAASNLVAGNNLEGAVQQILDMGGGSWDRDTVVRALRAAYNNPERAVEYLYTVSFVCLWDSFNSFSFWGKTVDLFVCYLIYEKRHSSKCWVGFACVAIRFRGGPILPWSFVWCMFMWYLF